MGLCVALIFIGCTLLFLWRREERSFAERITSIPRGVPATRVPDYFRRSSRILKNDPLRNSATESVVSACTSSAVIAPELMARSR